MIFLKVIHHWGNGVTTRDLHTIKSKRDKNSFKLEDYSMKSVTEGIEALSYTRVVLSPVVGGVNDNNPLMSTGYGYCDCFCKGLHFCNQQTFDVDHEMAVRWRPGRQ